MSFCDQLMKWKESSNRFIVTVTNDKIRLCKWLAICWAIGIVALANWIQTNMSKNGYISKPETLFPVTTKLNRAKKWAQKKPPVLTVPDTSSLLCLSRSLKLRLNQITTLQQNFNIHLNTEQKAQCKTQRCVPPKRQSGVADYLTIENCI